jgi:hypothetical protein
MSDLVSVLAKKNSTLVDIRISVCCKKTISYTYEGAKVANV